MHSTFLNIVTGTMYNDGHRITTWQYIIVISIIPQYESAAHSIEFTS